MSLRKPRKPNIIKDSQVFDRIFKNGNRLNSTYITVLYEFCDGGEVGFAVSRKIRGAARRNRAKRRLREVLRLSEDVLPPNISLVVVARPGAERVEFQTLISEFRSLADGLKERK